MEFLKGLPNHGNTCYLNTTLQCLFHTDIVKEFLDTIYAHERMDCIHKKKETLVAQAYYNLIHTSTNVHEDVRQFAHIVALSSKYLQFQNIFHMGDQHDMVELLQFILQCFHEAFKTKVEMNILGNIITKYDVYMRKAFQEWIRHFQNDFSFIVESFTGQFLTELVTIDTGAPFETTQRFDPFMILSLPIPSGVDRCTLYDCFQLFVHPEQIDGWKGSLSPCPRTIKQTTYLWKLPTVLIIHLKRFGNSMRKNNCWITIEDDILDMTPYVFESKTEKKIYSLYAIGNHIGSLHFGHYFAYCKHPETAKWYKYDDQHVSPLTSFQEVNSPSNYCLFYIRR